MEGIAQTRTSFGSGDHRWMGDLHGLNSTEGCTLDGSLFDLDVFEDGLLPSGTVLAKVTATGLYGPYSPETNEVQRITFAGTVTSYTVTVSGQTTAAINDKTAASLKAALIALSNIGPDDINVTGADGGPLDLDWSGDFSHEDVAAVTTTPTGGGTAAVTTPTAGGAPGASNGLQTAKGHLVSDQIVSAGSRNDAALLTHGAVIRNRLPANSGLDDAAETQLSHIRYRNI